MKRCPQCGRTYPDSAAFCQDCGVALEPAFEEPAPAPQEPVRETFTDPGQSGWQQAPSYGAAPNTGNEFYDAGGYNEGFYQGGMPPRQAPLTRLIQPRGIAVCIILSIVTCGIYGLYWLACMNDDMNALVADREASTGGMVVVLTIVTCGIYGLYWLYKMGEKLDWVKGNPAGNSNILFLVLGIFGLSIVSYALLQDGINHLQGIAY